MPATLKLNLYGMMCCHLCEEAKAVMQAVGVTAEPVDITEDDELLQRYGTRIPVIRRLDDNAELDWPFDETVLRHFIKA